jgi:hypothetical protein
MALQIFEDWAMEERAANTPLLRDIHAWIAELTPPARRPRGMSRHARLRLQASQARR